MLHFDCQPSAVVCKQIDQTGFFLDSLYHNSQRAIANKVLLQTPNPDKLIIKVEVIEIKISL